MHCWEEATGFFAHSFDDPGNYFSAAKTVPNLGLRALRMRNISLVFHNQSVYKSAPTSPVLGCKGMSWFPVARLPFETTTGGDISEKLFAERANSTSFLESCSHHQRSQQKISRIPINHGGYALHILAGARVCGKPGSQLGKDRRH